MRSGAHEKGGPAQIGEYIKLALAGVGTALLAFFFGIPGLIAAGLAALGVYLYNNEWVRSLAGGAACGKGSSLA